MNLSLTQILTYLESGSDIANKFVPPGTMPGGVIAIAGELARIALAAKRANEAITGQPLDLDKLKEIEHVNVEGSEQPK